MISLKKFKQVRRDYMDDLLELVIEFVFEMIGSRFEKKDTETQSTIDMNKLDETYHHDSYIAGLIATAIAINYEDDHRLDKHEKKMINELTKKFPYHLTKQAQKNINYIRKQKISLENLKIIYVKLNIDYYTVIKINNDLEQVIRYADSQDRSKKLDLIEQIRKENEHIHQQ